MGKNVLIFLSHRKFLQTKALTVCAPVAVMSHVYFFSLCRSSRKDRKEDMRNV
jgi:hypothetical protein